jgi:hypothetical protein
MSYSRVSPSTLWEHLPLKDIVLFTLVISATLAFAFWGRMEETLNSPDNAMRLVQIRALLNGAGSGVSWFDPFEPRLSPPEGYMTHWSRLIDAGVAGLIVFFRLFAQPELAEKLARAFWPMLLTLPAVLATCAIALRIAGTQGARTALLLSLGAIAASPMFRPGEIDHHNVQLVLVLMTLACAAWADQCLKSAWLTGVMGALLLAIGFEYVYLFALIFAVLAGIGLFYAPWRIPISRIFLGLGLSILIFWIGITPEKIRFVPVCDALALNTAFPIAILSFGLCALMMRGESVSTVVRIVGATIMTCIATFVFLRFEPRCLMGPYGTLDPRLFEVWMNHVEEVQPLFALFAKAPTDALIQLVFPLIALCFMPWLLHKVRIPKVTDEERYTSILSLLLIALFACAFIGLWLQVRIATMALWLGVPLVAWGVQVGCTGHMRGEFYRLIGAIALNPIVVISVIAALSLAIASLQKSTAQNDASVRDAQVACSKPSNFAKMAALPKGLVLGPRDLGSAVLLHTPHAMVSAPYHRLQRAILFTSDVMSTTTESAQVPVKQAGITYIFHCSGYLTPETRAMKDNGSLQMALLYDQPIPWLERLETGNSPLKIWRVR